MTLDGDTDIELGVTASAVFSVSVTEEFAGTVT
jgi:hypothetical protein